MVTKLTQNQGCRHRERTVKQDCGSVRVSMVKVLVIGKC